MLGLQLRLPERLGPKLVSAETLPAEVRARFLRAPEDAADTFRNKLLKIITDTRFERLADCLASDGLLMSRIKAEQFGMFVSAYERSMQNAFSASIDHSFLDLRRNPTLLQDPSIAAFISPLDLALLAFDSGGPVRLIGARAKDTPPAKTSVRDNGLHVDDSPFRREHKCLLVWSKGTTYGPQGQNFVAIARANNLVRIAETEHGANCKTVDEVLELLTPSLSCPEPLVIEAADEYPVLVKFDASRLPHHRYRSTDVHATRSCAILAFHRDDRMMPPTGMFSVDPSGRTDLHAFVFGGVFANVAIDQKVAAFLSAIEASQAAIIENLDELFNKAGHIPVSSKALSGPKLRKWLEDIAATQVTNAGCPRMTALPSGREELASLVLSISDFEKHRDLDLRLYEDGRELRRVSIRNLIRERDIEHVRRRPHTMRRFRDLALPSRVNVLTLPAVVDYGAQALAVVDKLIDSRAQVSADVIGGHQLLADLIESMGRCTTVEQFRLLSVFLYWTLDELYEMLYSPEAELCCGELDRLAQRILTHYASLVWLDDSAVRDPNPQVPQSTQIDAWLRDLGL